MTQPDQLIIAHSKGTVKTGFPGNRNGSGLIQRSVNPTPVPTIMSEKADFREIKYNERERTVNCRRRYCGTVGEGQ